MRLVRGAAFEMGADDFYPEEAPRRTARVDDFWIDEAPVTNREFRRFVEATGHKSFAEFAPDPADYPGMPPEMARAGSIVFAPPQGPVDLGGAPDWWSFVFGACWHAPLGPDSSIDGIEEHPVVHIAASDAEAYAEWAGKSLPTEAEWEYAARGGLAGASYAWGDELEPGGRAMAKIWQGIFPHDNRAPAGLERTSPVRSYPSNGFGLFDMIGNVWEWTRDSFGPPPAGDAPKCCGGSGSSVSAEGFAVRVTKGGSHLCAPNYCQRYRPAARWPQTVDTSTSHLGFRCIVRI
ncbi:MAG: formylglycine-generating enzyme family protein [Sphingopyxis sp.]|nr:formylglycine-generating enzyme family protein [Sphingopyxis sp.]